MTDTDIILPTPETYVFNGNNSEQLKLLVGIQMLNARTQEGKTYQTIATQWGTSHPTVMKYIKRALDSYTLPNVEDAKKEVLETIDGMIEAWRPKAKSNAQNADVLGRWIDKKIKLLGLDAPIKINQTVQEISKDEADLIALIEQTRHEEAMRLEALKNADNNA